MFTLLMMIENSREREEYKHAFESLHLVVLTSQPSYANYVKTLQYMPDVILMELPGENSRQLHFIQMIKQHGKAKSIPIICYGNPVAESISSGLHKIGVLHYFDRPLDISRFMNSVTPLIKKQYGRLEEQFSSKKSPKEQDMQLILSPETTRETKIELFVKHISGLLAFPFTISKVLKIANDPRAGAAELARVISTDPVLSADILKVANSVLFAASNRRITTIQDGIVRIGFAETRRIAMSMSVMNLFDVEHGSIGFNRINFWYHCLATAVISEHLARLVKNVSADEAFLAGMMHDFGIILLDEFFPAIFSRLLQVTTDKGAHFIDVEKELLGITHHDIVQRLFSDWQIPDDITQAVISHWHCCIRDTSQGDDTTTPLPACVGVANMIAKSRLLGGSCDQFVGQIHSAIFERFGLSPGFHDEQRKRIERDLDLYKKFLKIESETGIHQARQVFTGSSLKLGFIDCTKSVLIPPLLYLQSLEVDVTVFQGEVVCSQLDGMYDILCVWSSEGSADIDLIKKVSRIVCRPSQDQRDNPDTLKPEPLPLILFGNDAAPFRTILNDRDTIFFINTSLDLRQLDVIINAIQTGKKVVLTNKGSNGNQPFYSLNTKKIAAENYSIISDLTRMRKECKEKNIVSDETKMADTLTQAGRESKKHGTDEFFWLIRYAAALYRQAIARRDLIESEQTMAKIRRSLNAEQQKTLSQLIAPHSRERAEPTSAPVKRI